MLPKKFRVITKLYFTGLTDRPFILYVINTFSELLSTDDAIFPYYDNW